MPAMHLVGHTRGDGLKSMKIDLGLRILGAGRAGMTHSAWQGAFTGLSDYVSKALAADHEELRVLVKGQPRLTQPNRK